MSGESRKSCGSCRQSFCQDSSMDDIRKASFWRAVSAEFLGTLLLTFIGCGSCIGWESPPTIVQIALCFGLAVATVVWCIAGVSGGHINPAVTVSMMVVRKISVGRSILYIVVQCVGAICGAAILLGVTPQESHGALGSTTINPVLSDVQAFGVEFMITFMLVFTIFATCDEHRSYLKGSGPLAIGLSVTLCHLFAIPYTGSSMNPARTFGPAVVMGIWKHHWVYWCGPILGGVAAALLYEYIFAANATAKKARSSLLDNIQNKSLLDGEKETKESVFSA